MDDGSGPGETPDDDRPGITVDDAGIINEGSAAVFTVTLDEAAETDYAISFETLTGGNNTAEASDLGAMTVTYQDADGVTQTLTADNDGNYLVPAGITVLSVSVETTQDDVYEGAETFQLEATTASGASDTGNATIVDEDDRPDPTANPVNAAGLEDSDGIDITLQGSVPGGSGTVESFVVKTLPANGTLYFGNDVVNEGMAINATNGSATLTFEPKGDWSDNNGDPKASFDYIAVDELGNVSELATATIDVKPVTDTPNVELTLAESSTSSLYAVDLSNVLNNGVGQIGNPAGFTVTAFKDGAIGNISIKDTGSPTGFGVAGAASNGDAKEIGKGEVLQVDLNSPASSVTFQLAWLNGYNETAVYEVHYDDGTSQVFSVYGGSDGIDPAMTVDAPVGKNITGIDFRTGSDNASTSDYLLHTLSYESVVTTYTIDITAEPTDADYSESITSLIVKTPEGITLSGADFQGTDNEVTTWSIALDESGGFTNSVDVDADTGKVTVRGLVLSVPGDFTGELTVEAIATANDPGAEDTAVGRDSESVQVVAYDDGNYPEISHLAIAYKDDDGKLAFIKLENVLSGVTINDSQAIIQYLEQEGYEWRAIRAKGGSENSNHDASTFDYFNESKGVTGVEWKVNGGGQVNGVKHVVQDGDNIAKGQLVDGIVVGAMYTTSSGLAGTTDETGAFEYREGDSVTFMIGDVVIGTASAEALADGKVFLQELADVALNDLNDEYVENMAVFLQSLDADGNAYNGITITPAMHAAFENSTLDLRSASEAELKAVLEGMGAAYVNEEEAMQHVRDMLEKHAGVTAFEEHTDDSIQTAVLAHEALEGLTYQTSSGLTGELIQGAFLFDEGDTVELFANGQLVASFAGAEVGDDGLITFAEAGFNVTPAELAALVDGEAPQEEGALAEEDTEAVDASDAVAENTDVEDTEVEDTDVEDAEEAAPVESLEEADEQAPDADEATAEPEVGVASEGDTSGYTLVEDEPLFGEAAESDAETQGSGASSEAQPDEAEAEAQAPLSEADVLAGDDDSSVDSWLPSSEGSDEKAAPASASQEGQGGAESDTSVGHTDYVKLHNDHSSNNSDI